MERAFSHPPDSACSTSTAAVSMASVSSHARRVVSSMDLVRVLAPASGPQDVPSAAAAHKSDLSVARGAFPNNIPHRSVLCCRPNGGAGEVSVVTLGYP